MHIPYRSLLPKKIKGLLVAGRATGGDRIAHAATRNMACCAVAGQGAGIAAAQAVKSQSELENVDLAAIHKELDHKGVRRIGCGAVVQSQRLRAFKARALRYCRMKVRTPAMLAKLL